MIKVFCTSLRSPHQAPKIQCIRCTCTRHKPRAAGAGIPPSRYFRRSHADALTSHRRALFSQNPAPMPEDLVPVCTLGSCGGVRDRCADVPEVEAWEAEEVPVRALVMAEREGIKGSMR